MIVKDNGRAWRLMTAVPGHVFKEIRSSRMAGEAGRQLGEFHKTFKDFRERIKKPHPMFQYEEVLEKLHHHEGKLLCEKNPVVQETARFLLEHFPKYFLPGDLPRRLIHTDPKVSNFIFNDRGHAVAMIDLDTIQYLSPLYDLGDALRSFCGREESSQDNSFNMRNYRAFLRGYKTGSGTYLSRREWQLIPQATSVVILGLATRFLNDYVDDCYFNFDKKRYSSRKAHNLARALSQIELYKSFKRKSSRI